MWGDARKPVTFPICTVQYTIGWFCLSISTIHKKESLFLCKRHKSPERNLRALVCIAICVYAALAVTWRMTNRVPIINTTATGRAMKMLGTNPATMKLTKLTPATVTA